MSGILAGLVLVLVVVVTTASARPLRGEQVGPLLERPSLLSDGGESPMDSYMQLLLSSAINQLDGVGAPHLPAELLLHSRQLELMRMVLASAQGEPYEPSPLPPVNPLAQQEPYDPSPRSPVNPLAQQEPYDPSPRSPVNPLTQQEPYDPSPRSPVNPLAQQEPYDPSPRSPVNPLAQQELNKPSPRYPGRAQMVTDDCIKFILAFPALPSVPGCTVSLIKLAGELNQRQ